MKLSEAVAMLGEELTEDMSRAAEEESREIKSRPRRGGGKKRDHFLRSRPLSR
jgi:hypothetical protein